VTTFEPPEPPDLPRTRRTAHFAGFRHALRSLTLREEERSSITGASARRVIGIYIGWHGDWPYGKDIPKYGGL
jgi:hypothetical protein